MYVLVQTEKKKKIKYSPSISVQDHGAVPCFVS